MVQQQFSNCLLRIDEIACEDGLHFSFRVSVKTEAFEIAYTFTEMIYWQLSFKEHASVLEVFDKNAQRCKLRIDKKGIKLTIENEQVSSDTFVKLNQFEDQEKLTDWFIEFNATCEVIYAQH